MKILLLDIETAPIKGFAFEIFDTNLIHVIKPSYMLSFAVKWLGSDKTHVHALCDYSGYKREDDCEKKLLKSLWAYLDDAQIVVAHNGDNFDLKKINARFAVHELPLPSPYHTVDTLKICRRNYRFDSNKLDNVARYLGVGAKLPTQGKDTWVGCIEGDKEAWKTMKAYNAHDVYPLLEGVYLKVRAIDKSHPVLSDTGCPTCHSHKVQRRGVHITRTGKATKRHRYQCRDEDCGKWFVA